MKFETIFRRFTFNRLNALLENLPFEVYTKYKFKKSLVNVPPQHSHFLRPNFAHITKHTFFSSHTHLNLLS